MSEDIVNANVGNFAVTITKGRKVNFKVINTANDHQYEMKFPNGVFAPTDAENNRIMNVNGGNTGGIGAFMELCLQQNSKYYTKISESLIEEEGEYELDVTFFVALENNVVISYQLLMAETSERVS